MANPELRIRNGKRRWYARYRTPEGIQRSTTFDRKVDAEKFLAVMEVSKLTGAFVDPKRQVVTVGEWADGWLAGKANLAPKTRETYEFMVRTHIQPRWGTMALGKVRHVDIQAWLAGLDRSPATVRKVHQVFSQNDGLGRARWAVGVEPCGRHRPTGPT